MRSKGGKIFYRCEYCFSSDIIKKATFIDGLKNIYICNTCEHWGNWCAREKQSVLEYFNSIRPIVYLRKGNNVFIESHGILFDVKRVRVHPGMLYEINDKDMSRENPCDYGLGQITIDGKIINVKGRLG